MLSSAYGSGTHQPRIARTILLVRSPANLFIRRADSTARFFSIAMLDVRCAEL